MHFEAPAGPRLDAEMSAFIDWLNAVQPLDPVLKAALAHLWFVAVHPFDDGNGRIGRAIADMAPAHSDRSPWRFYSMSAQMRLERNAYYDILEATQTGNLDITSWLTRFLECLHRAIERSEETLSGVLSGLFEQVHRGRVQDQEAPRALAAAALVDSMVTSIIERRDQAQ